MFTHLLTFLISQEQSWDWDPGSLAPDTLNHCILCGLIIGHSTYTDKYLPCVNTMLGAEARVVNKTDKVPVPMELIFPHELILTTHEFMSPNNKTEKLLLLLLFLLSWLSYCNTSQTVGVWWSKLRRYPKPLSSKTQQTLAATALVLDVEPCRWN